MALLGFSIIMASVVFFCLRRPLWLPAFLGWSQTPPRLGPPRQEQDAHDDEPPQQLNDIALEKSRGRNGSATANGTKTAPPAPSPTGRLAVPPPPPVIVADDAPSVDSAGEEEQTTPKAAASSLPDDSVPSFSLSMPDSAPAPPAIRTPAPPSASDLMPPPPFPSRKPQPQPSPAPLTSAHAAGSSTLPTLSPLPNRSGPGSGPSSNRGGGLAPPPTLLAKPKKPSSKEIALAPGHSPLDWARLSGPTSDLRNLPPGTGYLRVTPTMLKYYTGRKGKDAWTVLGGRVYNITPYLPFHPGGEPELLRCAGRDGTKLFGEIHPWVNFEGMLSACLIGVYVPEETRDDSD
ncbi:hypothetical protein B0T16DRAFT_427843 [Cercophora newfieldiana]|uniref:Cytochrome b5 heme-binding domain-containing protein n=1 Tax=Cercophora newfieldiana TaxID=92897 RepID=A0AA39YA55_9PEZI|nr:hypothetical protein B0T16DRAFT_427843 [Cercophora newfieldiana]